MGSATGALYEVVVDEKDKKAKTAKRVFQLQDSKDPIRSVYQHQASQGRMVLMATTKRLYVFSGKGGLESMFANYTSPGTLACSACGCSKRLLAPLSPIWTTARYMQVGNRQRWMAQQHAIQCMHSVVQYTMHSVHAPLINIECFDTETS